MTLEVGLWRADGTELSRITPTGVALESQLEDYIESDPTLLSEKLMLVGRQVATAHGGYIDLLAVDSEGTTHVIELKRDKTPRDVVAQTIDYGSWVSELGRAEIVEIFENYQPGVAFEETFAEFFGEAPPDEINASQVFTIVASTVDAATERIVRFLNESFTVPINVVFFRHFRDNGVSYLARTWLVSQATTPTARPSSTKKRSRELWNGHDWYVSFGEEIGSRMWEDARRFGFVSAGGGEWFSRTLKNLPIGARVFACVPKSGYVGIGIVTGSAVRFSEAVVTFDREETKLADLPLVGNYLKEPSGDSDETAEYAVPVEWVATRPVSGAIWKTGMFANQNSACKLSKQFTIETVETAFGITDDH